MDFLNSVIMTHFLNGGALFAGLAMIGGACVLRGWVSRPGIQVLPRLLTILGVLLILLSGIPLPFWMYGVLLVLLIAQAFLPLFKRSVQRVLFVAMPILIIGTAMLMACTELSYHSPPTLPYPANKTVYVVGDSLSAMVDRGGKLWPVLLGEKTQLDVHNLSESGAKVDTALKNAALIADENSLVLLEIGGNDLLAGTPIAVYTIDMDALLARVSNPHRAVVLFELPLPPLYNRYGMVQRTLAKKYGVTLIPKKYLTQVIMASGATVDGLHLSNAGHEQLADSIAVLFRR